LVLSEVEEQNGLLELDRSVDCAGPQQKSCVLTAVETHLFMNDRKVVKNDDE